MDSLILTTQANFRNIKECSIDVSKSKTTIIYGINASGKSSFLESLYLNKKNHDLLKNKKINFILVPMNRIGKELSFHIPTIELLLQNKLSSFKDSVFSNIDLTNDTSVNEVFSASRAYSRDILSYKEDIKAWIDNLFDSSYFNVDNYNHNSDGYKSIYNLITYILYKSIIEENPISKSFKEYCETIRSIVLIDEIDSYIHQKIQFRILAFINSLFPNCKFILTTHSPIVLKSLPKDQFRYVINDGLIYERPSVYYENLDIIVQDEFNVNFSNNMSLVVLEFMNKYFENPSVVNSMNNDEKIILINEMKNEIGKSIIYSSRQIEWMNFIIEALK